MKDIKANHYVDTILYSADIVIKNLKSALRQKIDSLAIGITSEQFVVLDTISYYENMYQQKLSEILLKDKSNTTRIINVLSHKGYIKRDMARINNRLVYILNVTEEGRRLLEFVTPKIKKFVSEIFVNITDEEFQILRNLSKKFRSDIFRMAV